MHVIADETTSLTLMVNLDEDCIGHYVLYTTVNQHLDDLQGRVYFYT